MDKNFESVYNSLGIMDMNSLFQKEESYQLLPFGCKMIDMFTKCAI